MRFEATREKGWHQKWGEERKREIGGGGALREERAPSPLPHLLPPSLFLTAAAFVCVPLPDARPSSGPAALNGGEADRGPEAGHVGRAPSGPWNGTLRGYGNTEGTVKATVLLSRGRVHACLTFWEKDAPVNACPPPTHPIHSFHFLLGSLYWPPTSLWPFPLTFSPFPTLYNPHTILHTCTCTLRVPWCEPFMASPTPPLSYTMFAFLLPHNCATLKLFGFFLWVVFLCRFLKSVCDFSHVLFVYKKC